jgi:hypothetical protein
MNVHGLAISQGEVVSAEEGPDDAAVFAFDQSNNPTIIWTNWPAHATDGFYTAVAGTYPILIGGNDISRPYLSSFDPIHDVNPRTLYGLSADRRYLYLLTIDGRQPGYSDGAYDYEAAELLLLFGAADGMNLDGGGSTTLVVESSTGFPERLNKPSAVADSGHERTLGSHFGVFAKPLAGFINNVNVVPDDTTARVTWTTTELASSQVRYDTTTNLTQSTTLDPSLVQQHSIALTGLSPQTGYYFQILSTTATQAYSSSVHYFVTTNYVSTNQLFAITQPWLFTPQDVSQSNWTQPGYDDSGWSGPGPGLLWVDVRPTGPNPNVNPKNTQMPADPTTGYPYPTYYFRTHVTVVDVATNSTLQCIGFIDDGAVFYVNGVEAYRLRMLPGPVSNQTFTTSYPCNGDATCTDEFTCTASLLKPGDNVVAVEVHNYNARSADITFGISISLIQPLPRNAKLEAAWSGQALTLTWTALGFALESATVPTGPWTAVGGASTSPFVTTTSGASRYYRLRR